MQPTIQIPQLPPLKSDGTFDTPAVQRFFEDIQKTLQSKQLDDYSNKENLQSNITDLSDNLPATIKENLNASGSAPIYACRAWVNFNGTGTITIRGSGNVASITDIKTGYYYFNFITAMPDDNTACVVSTHIMSSLADSGDSCGCSSSRGSVAHFENLTLTDSDNVYVAVFR